MNKKRTTAKLRFLKDFKLRSSRYAAPKVAVIESKKFVFKRLGLGEKLSKHEAKELAGQMKAYRTLLVEAGINVPEIRAVRAIEERHNGKKTGHCIICSLERFVGSGKDVHHLIESANKTTALQAYGKTMEVLSKFISLTSKPAFFKTSTMIDSVPRNFVIDAKGRILYVDLFVPKLRDKNGRLIPFKKGRHNWSKKALEFKFGDKRGIVASLLVYAISLRPKLRRQLEKATFQALEAKGETKLAEYLKEAAISDYKNLWFIREKFIDRVPQQNPNN